jgi:hypothetical protein
LVQAYETLNEVLCVPSKSSGAFSWIMAFMSG